MYKQDRFQRRSREAALCGMMTALSVVVLSLGSLIPLATFACPMLAMICLIPAVCEFGTKPSLMLYAAASILALLLCPDKEIALLYMFLGWYPALRSRLSGVPKILGAVIKCALFSLAMVVMYALIIYIFQLTEVVSEFSEYSAAMTIGLLALGNVTFLLFDRVLAKLAMLYRKKRKL